MEEKLLRLFLKVRESFTDVKDKVSLIKPYFELLCFATGWALKIEEYEKIFGFNPEYIYMSEEQIYGIAASYRIDDEITEGIIAREFAEIVAREKDITDLDVIDRICVERGFGEQLLSALQNDILPGMVERDFIVREHLEMRVKNLKDMLEKP